MDALLSTATILILLAIFGATAAVVGADSRDGFDDAYSRMVTGSLPR